MSLRELARRIGKSPSLISRIEKGLEQGSIDTLQAICQELGMNLDEVVNGTPAVGQKRCPECAEIDPRLKILLVEHPEIQKSVLDLAEAVTK